jgi:hypothetical protein
MLGRVASLSIAGAIVVSAAGLAVQARPAEENTSFFLSSRTPFNMGHVPLAVVRGADVLDAVPRRRPGGRQRDCGARTRWAAVGSRWRALDEWGQVVATRAVSRRSIYDVTTCAEVTLSQENMSSRQALYVSEDSAWRASPSPAWTPPAPVQASFEALARATIDDGNAGRRAVQRECAGMSRAVAFFTNAAGKHYGVATSNVGFLVATLDGQSWTPVISKADLRKRAPYYTCYRPVSIFDMNADGNPEVVLFQSMGESWGDLVLGMGSDGSWRIVAISPGSGIA